MRYNYCMNNGQNLSEKQKAEIKAAVKKTVKKYRKTLHRLAST